MQSIWKQQSCTVNKCIYFWQLPGELFSTRLDQMTLFDFLPFVLLSPLFLNLDTTQTINISWAVYEWIERETLSLSLNIRKQTIHLLTGCWRMNDLSSVMLQDFRENILSHASQWIRHSLVVQTEVSFTCHCLWRNVEKLTNWNAQCVPKVTF